MKIIGGDTETFKGRPMSYQLFGDKIEIIRFENNPTKFCENFCRDIFRLTSSTMETALFFHNLQFDLCQLFYPFLTEFLKDEFEIRVAKNAVLKGFFSSPAPSYALLSIGRKRIHFFDTACFFMKKLSSLADDFNLGIKKYSTPKNIGEKLFYPGDKNFVSYAMRDAEICYRLGKIITSFHEQYEIKQTISLSQLAERIFRHKFLKKPILALPNKLIWPSLRSYHGGKNGIYIKKGYYKKVFYYDVVSMYPYAMKQLPQFSEGKFFEVNKFYTEYVGIYFLTGTVKKCLYPIIYDDSFKPLNGEIENQAVTSYEIKEALERKELKIKSIKGYIWVPDKKADSYNPFCEYIDHFYELKKNTDKKNIYYNFYKTLMNALYGKFIQRRESKSIDGEVIYHVGNMFNPFIASLITGFARAKLHYLEHSFSSIHSATDSIMTIRPISKKYLGTKIGDLNFEFAGSLYLLRNKLYLMTDEKGKIKKYALHGFRGTKEQLQKMFINNQKEYTYKKMNRLKESFIQGLTPFVFEEKKAVLNLENN